ncbi:MAG: phosphoenolpyruvate synthase [Candidatus Pacearchaeota archaeon]|nr:phosphoenolpyruvate synthase [Candidatus Pacearchaeota archaeon]
MEKETQGDWEVKVGKDRWHEIEPEKIVEASRNIVWLSEIGKKDIAIGGGKGANLAEMYNADLPVPPAFIVTAQAYQTFVRKSGIRDKILAIVNSIDIENTAQLETKTKEVRDIIVSAEMPKELADEIIEAYSNISVDRKSLEEASGDVLNIITAASEPCFVAVRSSATTEDLSTASFAGQQETYLNIKGNQALLEAIKKCWASLFTARAVYYRTKKGFSHEHSFIAVIVQKMVNSEKSGVTFTVNPLTNSKDEIIIEAVFGLGEGIVSGTIEPDNYVVDKKTLKLLRKRIGNKKISFLRSSTGETIKKELPEKEWGKEVLDPYELRSVANYAVRIEEHYKWPQDIEWAIEGGKVYIVQSRPVTTLEKEMKEVKIEAKELIEGLGASSGMATGTVRIIHDLKDLQKVQRGDVLVTRMTNPDMVVTMQKACAIVTDEGGLTAHAAIVSREVGIPCVVGTRIATKILKEGQVVTVDGTNGKIYEGKIEKPIPREKEKEIKGAEARIEVPTIPEQVKEAFEELRELKLERERKKPLVKVNCDLPEVAERAAATGADGVGLVRIEFIIAKGGVHPAEYIRRGQSEKYIELLVEGIEKIAHAFNNKPVWVRTSDIRTDEYRGLEGANNEPREDNPMIGWHGIRRGLDEPEILKAEFAAIKKLHNKGYKHVGVMIPFLINVEELRRAKEIMNSIGLEPGKDVKFGAMIETPASCWIIEELCKEGLDFISFGTNDLTQLTLGIDRNNERLARIYNEMHPSVLGQMAKVIEVCRRYGVETSICGQAGSTPAMARFLTQQGISSISANIDSVPLIREAVDDAFKIP